MQIQQKIKADGIYNRYIKRIIDLVLALIMAIVLLPFYFLGYRAIFVHLAEC